MTALVQRIVEAYGPHPRQVGEWFLPDSGPAGSVRPVVCVVHGGYWRPQYDRSLQDAVCEALAHNGFAVWNIEYRAYDQPWPAGQSDVAAGLDHAARSGHWGESAGLIGHSAGGMLALWAASRRSLPTGAPGSDPLARFDVVVAQAPIACLAQAWAERLGDGAVDTLMGGGPAEHPSRYAVTDPVALTPDDGTRVVLLHGDADDTVPLSQSEGYAATHAAEVVVMPGDGHYEVLDPTSAATIRTIEILRQNVT